MTLYGSLDAIKAKLQPTVTTEWSADDDANLTSIRAAVSAAIEDELGRSFGAPVADTTVIAYAGPYPTLVLPTRARSITSVEVGGTVDGGTVTGGTAYASSLWAHDPVDLSGNILGLRLLSGGWWGSSDAAGTPLTPVKIVGDFSDTDDDADVPDEITEAANFLIAETYKYQHASPAGFTGSDGATVPIRDPWKDPLVARTFAKWRVGRREWVV